MLARRHRTDFVSEARLIWMNGRPNLASGNDPGTSTLGLSRRKAADEKLPSRGRTARASWRVAIAGRMHRM